ncbi:HD domain-containing protein [Staphylococcus sp. 11261D007BR]
MTQIDYITQSRAFMTSLHQRDHSGHDHTHVERVLQLALTIAKDYPNANLRVIQLAALLHDTVDEKLPHAISIEALRQFLNRIHVSKEEQDEIVYVITHMSFRHRHQVNTLQTIEAQIVQDADRLDALGAIGLARTFQFAGVFEEPLWTGHYNYNEMQQMEDVTTLPPSAVKHCFEKLLKLKDLMNTPKGKKIADQRHHVVETFLQQFFNEWQSHHLD